MKMVDDFVTAALAMLPTIVITMIGNTVRYTRHHRQEPFSPGEFACGMFAAAFMGVMIHAFCYVIGASGWLQMAVGGMCGYAGVSLLDTVAALMVKQIKVFFGGGEKK